MRSVKKTILDLFVVPANSIGIPVPTGVICPLDAEGEKLLTSHVKELREGGAPDAEVEVVAELARLGHMRIEPSDEDTPKGAGWWSPFSIRPHYATLADCRLRRCLQAFFGLAKDLDVCDRYGHIVSYGRYDTIPQIPKMTIEEHIPPSNEEVFRFHSYVGEPEHPASTPLPGLKTVSQLAQLTSSELGEYLRFLIVPHEEYADRNTKLELLKKEIGFDCLGAAEFSVEPLTDHETQALSTYLQHVGAQLTDLEAKIAKYTKIQPAVEGVPYDPAIIEGPCVMFRQLMFASNRFRAQRKNWDVPEMTYSETMWEVPDWYGNVPSGGRNVHIPAQAASRTALHIPGLDKVLRYVVLDAIVEHPKVEPLPALTRVRQVMQLTPDQVNQYLKFYCVEVPENADINQRLQLLKVELTIDHVGPAGFRKATGLELYKRKTAQYGESESHKKRKVE